MIRAPSKHSAAIHHIAQDHVRTCQLQLTLAMAVPQFGARSLEVMPSATQPRCRHARAAASMTARLYCSLPSGSKHHAMNINALLDGKMLHKQRPRLLRPCAGAAHAGTWPRAHQVGCARCSAIVAISLHPQSFCCCPGARGAPLSLSAPITDTNGAAGGLRVAAGVADRGCQRDRHRLSPAAARRRAAWGRRRLECVGNSVDGRSEAHIAAAVRHLLRRGERSHLAAAGSPPLPPLLQCRCCAAPCTLSCAPCAPMTLQIGHAGDGGLYAELVQDRRQVLLWAFSSQCGDMSHAEQRS